MSLNTGILKDSTTPYTYEIASINFLSLNKNNYTRNKKMYQEKGKLNNNKEGFLSRTHVSTENRIIDTFFLNGKDFY
jgi:hypothetical protein